jgi:methyl-accepting chemotaxis protein PixJ
MTAIQASTSHSPQPDNQVSAINRVQTFVQNHLIGTITITISASLVLGGLSTWNIWRIYNGSRSTITDQFALEKLSGKIVHLDEVLTMSAKMAASTGDLSWEKRYNQYVPELDKALKTTLAKVPASIQSEAAKTDDANTKLVAMETKAFGLVQQGKSREAGQVLSGPEYVAQKTIYAQGNSRVLKQIEQFIQQKVADYQEQLRISIVTAVIILPVVLASWLLVLSAVRAYIRDRIAAQAKLESSRSELFTLAEDLRQEATLRQEQEQSIRSESDKLQEDIEQLLNVVSAVEEGNLTVQAPVSDRVTGLVSDTLNRLIEELNRVMSTVSTTSQQVTDSATDLEQLATQSSQQAKQQTEAVEQIKALVQDVTQLTQGNTQQSTEANLAVQQAQSAVVQGQLQMNNLNGEISTLQGGADQITRRVQTLSEFVQLATQFVKAQKRTASMTRVLALNASLLSTRATEQQDPEQFASISREFETITAQVNDLASQTNQDLIVLQQRTEQIQTVVSGLSQDVQEINQTVKAFTEGVGESNQVFDNIQAVTSQVVQVGQRVAESSQAIAQASQTTLASVQDIATLAMATEQRADITREQSSAMGQLSRELLKVMSFFKISAEQMNGDQTLESERTHEPDSKEPILTPLV